MFHESSNAVFSITMESSTAVQFPKVAIRFCVQCKWNLRAAYFAQELLSTFSDALGEVSLIPVTGGIFTINLYHKSESVSSKDAELGDADVVQDVLIWDRKRDGGFPETKELKNRVRNVIDPERDMGHVDRALKKGQGQPDGQVSNQVAHSEGSGPAAAMSTMANHSEHKAKDAPPKDCEECMEAAKAHENVDDKF